MHAPAFRPKEISKIPYSFPELVQLGHNRRRNMHSEAESALETAYARSRLSLQPYTQNARIGNWIACEQFVPENPARDKRRQAAMANRRPTVKNKNF